LLLFLHYLIFINYFMIHEKVFEEFVDYAKVFQNVMS